MRRLNAPLILLCVASSILAGCQSVDRRINQHAEVFATLTPAEQARVRAGDIQVGDTLNMVQLAFGQPDEYDAFPISTGATRTTWTYFKTKYIKEASRLGKIDVQQNTAQVEDVYRVLYQITQQVTFIDDEVVHVRQPLREAQALAALGSR
ncbi:hypothetical protein [Synoicihabitans lomoniglobus]|uniref:Outer membrane protein assembly factor BamE n=1 Tax=Synoicihabitans lomoniglobus TaxID=2909285 RepID=A0AAE9ZVF0_9BACT|nr:hypothetical protein [Opitutaceae bacterium LMO-M01]WED63849.1 hypothetical protein PXH66_16040 [Opitutaceae bacterium LMO-M01]